MINSVMPLNLQTSKILRKHLQNLFIFAHGNCTTFADFIFSRFCKDNSVKINSVKFPFAKISPLKETFFETSVS